VCARERERQAGAIWHNPLSEAPGEPLVRCPTDNCEFSYYQLDSALASPGTSSRINGNLMKTWRNAIAVFRNPFHLARIHIARPDALLSLAILGLVTGIVTGLVIVLFRYAIDGLRILLIPERQIGDFEALPVEMRLLLAVAGAVLIALISRLIG